ncbi:MAG: MFS transporter [Hyphomicrobiaceae bacterium]
MKLEQRVLVWMCVLVGINQLGFGAMIPSLPLYAESFGVPASAIGMAVAVYGLARFFVAMPSGQLSDRLGRRPTLAIGGLISALGNLWCAWATSYPEFIAARFVAGAGAGLIVTTGQIVLADITVPANRGRMLSIYQGTIIFAVGVGPIPGGLVAEHYGLAAPFIAYGIAALGATIVAWFAVKETRDLGQSGSSAGKSPKVGFMDRVSVLTRNIGYVLVCLIVFANAFVRTGGLFSVVPIIAHQRLDISVARIGFAMMLGSVAGLIATYPAGWLVDQFGRKTVIVPVTMLTGAAMTLFAFAPSFSWFVAASITWGIAVSVGGSAPAAYAADMAPPGMNATALGFFRMMADLGYVVGPLALGLMVDLFNAETSLYIAAALIILSGVAFAIFAPESHRSGHKVA